MLDARLASGVRMDASAAAEMAEGAVVVLQ